MKKEESFLGTGWSFPPEFDKNTADVKMTSAEEDIKRSLYILLSTTVGERVMQPAYGCNLKRFLFEPLNATTIAYVRKLVEDAIVYFEPRIELDGVSVEIEEGTLNIIIDFRIRATNARSNLVYPFYLKEGT
ncbi:MAG TPA: hypothetical protein ENK42_05905 [Deltaproteobacteria bacterium]|nr:hypothetical protein [Deltaproteobacteria bacterium]